MQRDLAAARVRRAAECGFEITGAPVVASEYELRLLREHFLHARKIAVSGADELLDGRDVKRCGAFRLGAGRRDGWRRGRGRRGVLSKGENTGAKRGGGGDTA